MLNFSVTFIITVLNITILFLILRKILFKPVTKFIAERTNRIQTSISQAEKDKSLAQKMLEQYQNRLLNAEAEADAIIKTAHEQAEADAEQIIIQSKAEAERIKESGRIQLETDRLAAMAVFRAEATMLVLSAAGRLVGRELSGPEQQRFAAETLDNIIKDSGQD